MPRANRHHRLHRVQRALSICRSRGRRGVSGDGLQFHGRRDLAAVFADSYFNAAGDADGRALCCPFTVRTGPSCGARSRPSRPMKAKCRRRNGLARPAGRAGYLDAGARRVGAARAPALLDPRGRPARHRKKFAGTRDWRTSGFCRDSFRHNSQGVGGSLAGSGDGRGVRAGNLHGRLDSSAHTRNVCGAARPCCWTESVF